MIWLLLKSLDIWPYLGPRDPQKRGKWPQIGPNLEKFGLFGLFHCIFHNQHRICDWLIYYMIIFVRLGFLTIFGAPGPENGENWPQIGPNPEKIEYLVLFIALSIVSIQFRRDWCTRRLYLKLFYIWPYWGINAWGPPECTTYRGPKNADAQGKF